MLEVNDYSLNALSKIKGAFDRGQEYLCTKSDSGCYTKGRIYRTNGVGILDNCPLGFYCSTGGDTVLFTPILPEEGYTPLVGLQFKFQHEFEEDYKYLGEDYIGWENGDLLEIIHKTTNHDGEEVFIVLNTQEDVLSTAVLPVEGFCLHEAPPTEEDKQMTKLMNLFPDGECISLHQAEVIVKAGWKSE